MTWHSISPCLEILAVSRGTMTEMGWCLVGAESIPNLVQSSSEIGTYDPEVIVPTESLHERGMMDAPLSHLSERSIRRAYRPVTT